MEEVRLSQSANSKKWKKWGPYLAERQWGTVREDYSAHGNAWTYITHDLAVIKDISDRVAVMLRGDLVEEGPVAQVLSRPQHDYTKMLLGAELPIEHFVE